MCGACYSREFQRPNKPPTAEQKKAHADRQKVYRVANHEKVKTAKREWGIRRTANKKACRYLAFICSPIAAHVLTQPICTVATVKRVTAEAWRLAREQSRERKQKWIEMYKRGFSTTEIASTDRVNPGAVYAFLKGRVEFRSRREAVSAAMIRWWEGSRGQIGWVSQNERDRLTAVKKLRGVEQSDQLLPAQQLIVKMNRRARKALNEGRRRS